jgi:hypothetical protein
VSVSEFLAVEEADVRGSRPLGRFLDREFDALSFSKQLEYRATHGRAMEEVLYSAFVTNKAETFVD